ncbi:MAG: hypothetical protein AB7P21_23250 [Lautropia sp.]
MDESVVGIGVPDGVAQVRRDAPARRRVLRAGAMLAGGGLVLAAVRPAQAHHGFAGHYDFSSPLYLAGRVESSWIGFPHARLSILPDPDLRLPRARDAYRALEDAEGRAMLSRLRLLRQVGAVEVSLDAAMTRVLFDDPSMLPEGSRTELILYRRRGTDEYRHELLAVLVRLSDGRMLVGSGRAASERESPVAATGQR